MLEKIKKIFKRKPKVKVKEEVLVLAEDKTFENEIKKPEVKSETKETKSETTSSLTFGE
jgi:mannose/fructose/N-acetylgalactosamine-specific phosphotransferase system component IIB